MYPERFALSLLPKLQSNKPLPGTIAIIEERVIWQSRACARRWQNGMCVRCAPRPSITAGSASECRSWSSWPTWIAPSPMRLPRSTNAVPVLGAQLAGGARAGNSGRMPIGSALAPCDFSDGARFAAPGLPRVQGELTAGSFDTACTLLGTSSSRSFKLRLAYMTELNGSLGAQHDERRSWEACMPLRCSYLH